MNREEIIVEALASRRTVQAVFPRDWTCDAHGDTCPKHGLDWDCIAEGEPKPCTQPGHSGCERRVIGGEWWTVHHPETQGEPTDAVVLAALRAASGVS